MLLKAKNQTRIHGISQVNFRDQYINWKNIYIYIMKTKGGSKGAEVMMADRTLNRA